MVAVVGVLVVLVVLVVVVVVVVVAVAVVVVVVIPFQIFDPGIVVGQVSILVPVCQRNWPRRMRNEPIIP